ncbi:hypothetical protein SDC9_128055 [bioreactor metagenome]|uniref:Uncharacterized protein n=1 Tax=bioreactor metagenome TaxID=1076179 RepID=A0A645CVR2_9ZZZZ
MQGQVGAQLLLAEAEQPRQVVVHPALADRAGQGGGQLVRHPVGDPGAALLGILEEVLVPPAAQRAADLLVDEEHPLLVRRVLHQPVQAGGRPHRAGHGPARPQGSEDGGGDPQQTARAGPDAVTGAVDRDDRAGWAEADEGARALVPGEHLVPGVRVGRGVLEDGHGSLSGPAGPAPGGTSVPIMRRGPLPHQYAAGRQSSEASQSSSVSLRSSRPPYPPRDPSAMITRWTGMIHEIAVAAQALAAARAPRGAPAARATSP